MNELYTTEHLARQKHLRSLLTLVDLDGQGVLRLGNSSDGGYVLMDCLNTNIACLSFGIGNDPSFDYDVSKFVSNVYMFDHTIADVPNLRPNMFFYKTALKNKVSDQAITLDSVAVSLKIESEYILKIDIEGDEWKVLADVTPSVLLKAQQILIEFHNLNRLDSDETYLSVISSLKKLNLGHALVNIHANNWARCDFARGQIIPEVLETTWVRKDLIRNFESKKIRNSISCNFPNNANKEDIELNYFELKS